MSIPGYSRRKWLNPEGHPSTGSVVAYHGESSWCSEGKPEKITMLEISDCHCKVRLHRTEIDTMDSFIDKMVTLRNVVDEFITHLKGNSCFQDVSKHKKHQINLSKIK